MAGRKLRGRVQDGPGLQRLQGHTLRALIHLVRPHLLPLPSLNNAVMLIHSFGRNPRDLTVSGETSQTPSEICNKHPKDVLYSLLGMSQARQADSLPVPTSPARVYVIRSTYGDRMCPAGLEPRSPPFSSLKLSTHILGVTQKRRWVLRAQQNGATFFR